MRNLACFSAWNKHNDFIQYATTPTLYMVHQEKLTMIVLMSVSRKLSSGFMNLETVFSIRSRSACPTFLKDFPHSTSEPP
jgi:hypothetical protein